MRFFTVLTNDIRYQIKYGFYLIYTLISMVYVAVLFFVPDEIRRIISSVIILTDPVMLGSFFIGGIWLLEKGEDIHAYWNISPLRTTEYILSKALSLAVISVLTANFIVVTGLRESISYFALSGSVFWGSVMITMLGLIIASCSKSVNQYMLFISPFVTVITLPPILMAFGITSPVFDIIPGTPVWRMISYSVGAAGKPESRNYFIFALWLGIMFFLAYRRILKAMREDIENNLPKQRGLKKTSNRTGER